MPDTTSASPFLSTSAVFASAAVGVDVMVATSMMPRAFAVNDPPPGLDVMLPTSVMPDSPLDAPSATDDSWLYA